MKLNKNHFVNAGMNVFLCFFYSLNGIPPAPIRGGRS